MDMERMHLSGGNHPGSSSSSEPSHPSGGPGGHLYPGYPSSSAAAGGGGYGGEGGMGAKGDTPYSRSPELRVSHKLAERKRRKEMKELFDELRDSLPVDRSLKTSKWEILSKGTTQQYAEKLGRTVDYISGMKSTQDEMAKEIESLRQHVFRLQKH
ncbi:hypothetical protein EDD11_005584 [Mortierella claussenii]|nr:hypothetical protein EDD11_005584 [Mortierella claussenii]